MVSLVVLSTGDTAEGKIDGDDIIVTLSISHLCSMFEKDEESREGTSLVVQRLRLHRPLHGLGANNNNNKTEAVL